MALQFKKPFRSRLTVAGSVVKTQQREGISFYIIPTVIVLAVLIFCYTATPPASALLAQKQKAQAAVEKKQAPETKSAVSPTPAPPVAGNVPPAADDADLLADADPAEVAEDEEDDILALEGEETEGEEDLDLWDEEEDEDWIDGGEEEEFVGDEDFEAVEDDEESAAAQEDDEPTEEEEPAEDGDAGATDAETPATPAVQPTGTPQQTPTPAASDSDKKAKDEEFKNKLKDLFN